ncbi:MAG: hypothetical protein COZ57_13360 [Armatimonadetes bacterium CG_4_8_14_3_um_filter_66_20]|nr:MAG: hypothetical protein COZ57_13360 [Armatimonadetes bacterium CG_4_8_14_3_um_filter_66_20]
MAKERGCSDDSGVHPVVPVWNSDPLRNAPWRSASAWWPCTAHTTHISLPATHGHGTMGDLHQTAAVPPPDEPRPLIRRR